MINNNELIEKYLLSDDLSTYDPYDIWNTSIGIKIKQFYYKHKFLGLFPAGFLTIYDLYLNNSLRMGYKKQEYPIVRAQAALTLMNLYQTEPKKIYLKYIKNHIDWLIKNSSKGYSGYCWGLNITWVYSAKEIYAPNTPFSTYTPYPLEILSQYYLLTGDQDLLGSIKSVFDFIENDLQIMIEDKEKLVISYGAQKDRIVTNANSYVMYMYALLLPFFPDKKEYLENKIQKIFNFLTAVQNSNGSWLYSPYESNSFIDCFHSCFVIKNIYKTNQITQLNMASSVVKKGYNYILNNFLDEDYFLFKRFVISNKPSLVKFDLYDNAEMLNLAILLRDDVTAKKLDEAIKKTFVKKNKIYSTIDILNFKKNLNHSRWAVIPYLHALSGLKEK